MSPDPRPEWVLTRRREIGHRIARWRAHRGMTVDQLAGAAGVARTTVLHLEHAAKSAGLDVLLQIADGLGVRIGQMLDEEPSQQ